jgi:hypothetical protein
MGLFGIQIGNREYLNKKVIGKVLLYPLLITGNKKTKNVSVDTNKNLNKYEEVDIVAVEQVNGKNVYISNKWNDTFDDIQAYSENCVKEFIRYDNED